jgi:type VI secretion system (T6SS) immunity protein Tdi1
MQVIASVSMFENFLASFQVLPEEHPLGHPWSDERLNAAAGYPELAGQYAGRAFDRGIYRLHDENTGPRAAAAVAEAFPDFAHRARPFARDWLGRQFALDSARAEGGEQLVLLLEPGTGQALEVPLSFAAFHEQLDELREPALAASFFESWAEADPASVPLGPDKCAGYRVPLFLGGKDVVTNLEVIDLDVYWSVCGQLRQGTRTMPPGTSISGVSIND